MDRFRPGFLARSAAAALGPATLAVVFPFSAASAGKAGGTWNSLLPALLAMMAFVTLRLPNLARFLDNPGNRLRTRILLGVCLAVLMLLTAFPRRTLKHGLLEPRTGWNANYEQVIKSTANLPGSSSVRKTRRFRFMPGNTSVRTSMWNMTATWSMASGRPGCPSGCVTEVRSADYIVDVHNWWQDLLDDEQFRELGFAEVDKPGFDTTYYKLWRNTRR